MNRKDNKRLVFLVSIICTCIPVIGQKVRVCYVPDIRARFQDNGYTLDGKQMKKGSLPKLLNKRHFGDHGVVKYNLEPFSLTVGTITETELEASRCSVVFLGVFYTPATKNLITIKELETVRKWSLRNPSNLVIVCENNAEAWGYQRIESDIESNEPTDAGLRTELFRGPFGMVNQIQQGGHSKGYLTGGESEVLACDKVGRPTIILDKSTNDIILSDVDLLTSLGGVSTGKNLQTSADTVLLNFWAYVCRLADEELNKTESISAISKSGIFRMSTILFAQSSDQILPDGKAVLDSIIPLVQNKQLRIELSGYTDILGDSRKNLRLSQRRAVMVKNYLINAGISPQTIFIQAFGAERALYKGKDGLRSAANRRVEVKLRYPD